MSRLGLVLLLAALIGLLALVAWSTLESPDEPRRADTRAGAEEAREPIEKPPPLPDEPRPAGAPEPAPRAPEPAPAVVGLVLGPDGKPAAGVKLYLASAEQIAVVGVEVARSGEDGRFRLEAAPGKADLLAYLPGAVPAVVRDLVVREGKDTDAGTIRLEAGLAVAGQVVDTGKNPVEGALVTAYRDESLTSPALLPAREGVLLWGARALTDERGDFRLGGLSREPVLVIAEALGYRMVGDPAEAVPGATDVRILLKKLRLATGKVVTEVGQIGIPGATVKLVIRGSAGSQTWKMTTVQSGRFTLDLSDEKYASDKLRYDVYASADGYEDASLADLTIDDLLPDAKLRIPLVRAPVRQPGRLRGRALYDTGEPFGRAQFTLSFGAEGKAGQVFRVVTDENGEFLLEGVPAGEYVLRTAPRRSLVLRDTGQTLVIPPGGEETTEFVFTRGGDVEVRVSGYSGQAIEGAEVRVLDEAGRPGDPFTAAKGAVVMHDLPPGVVRLRVSAPGHEPHEVGVTVEKDARVTVPVQLEEKR